MCQPICCGGQRQLLAPPQQMMPMMPAAAQYPSYQAPVVPQMAPPIDYSLMNTCSPSCTPQMCSLGCPTQCCTEQQQQPLPPFPSPKKKKRMNGVSPHELEARRNYQEMLRSFREKQLESYLQG